MWTEEQLNAAKYVAFSDQESQQNLNIGTIEITGTNGGIFLMRPAPPFGSLGSSDSSIEGVKAGVCLPVKSVSVAYQPRGFPIPDRQPMDQFLIHDFGKCNL